ncbi:flagellar assembly protein FliH [Acidovorax sp. HMWF029]|jgi:flagellar assembly protein FliH|uniref:FliH/SctL family protein n=1 Tax=unclassified Acidovorax TaxID=2684926 RepID=UPI000D3ABB4C|nr:MULTISPECIES: flagellar assembly protein FliH [unclassified Acidovorax]MDH4416121.1 flagellar assembly protein FliH [Acidovorax sp.]PTT19708.1 flagellar assembly protein FliH [Acidovorax sp. HMWF029]
MMPSSNQRSYSRFIPSEEVGDFKQWKFSAVDGSDLDESMPKPVAEIPVEIDEAELHAQQALLQQQACDDAYAEGFAQGQAQTALEWQRRMDDYIAQQGQESAQRLQGVLQTLDASLIDMQQQMAQQLLELACDIARQVVRQELSVNPNALQPVVREAVGMLVTEGRPATVRLNPIDMEAVAQPLREELDGPGVQWMADAAVPAGGCLVESAGTVVDGSLDKRWQRAIAALGLQSPWSEGEGDER